ncbi:MAG: MBL fold metallo-hydrolase [Saccharofermentans sp.]|nr:MBL fold metallo-hydrolase [Saccharofermentans sp.]
MNLDISENLKLQRFTWDVVDANTYMIFEQGKALVIDPVDSPELYDSLEHVEEIDIILTHCHFDHISGLNHIRKTGTDLHVIATSTCSKNIGSIYRNMSSAADAFLSFYNQKRGKEYDNDSLINSIDSFICEPADVVFDDTFEFVWNNHVIRLIRCYGHSDDSLIALFDDKYLFSGDTLLNIPTATRFLGGSTSRFWKEDYPLLTKLSSSVEMVFPGHGDYGRIDDMLSVNVMPERFSNKKQIQ